MKVGIAIRVDSVTTLAICAEILFKNDDVLCQNGRSRNLDKMRSLTAKFKEEVASKLTVTIDIRGIEITTNPSFCWYGSTKKNLKSESWMV